MKTEKWSVLQMKSNIDKAINYLQIYRMDKNPDYLVMAHREMKKEVQAIKELSLTSKKA